MESFNHTSVEFAGKKKKKKNKAIVYTIDKKKKEMKTPMIK